MVENIKNNEDKTIQIDSFPIYNKKQKKNIGFLNKKLIGMPFIFLIAMSFVFVIAVSILYASVPTNVTVNESLSVIANSITIPNIYPGENFTQNITIVNSANVNSRTEISWETTSNINNVTFINDLPRNVTLFSGNNNVGIVFTIKNDSAIGEFNGSIVLKRIA